jgi:glycosyltransferase involved in cell wall biosynthesis
MKILLYMTGGPHWLGGAQYTRNLLLALQSLAPETCPPVVIKIVRSRDCTNLEKLANESSNIIVDREYLKLMPGGKRAVARISDECTILFPEKGVEMPATHQTPIHWIPDFQYKYLPDYFSEQERQERDERYEKLLDNARFLVLSSQSALADFRKFHPRRTKLPVFVLSFRAIIEDGDLEADPFASLSRFDLPEKFVYCPNQMWQHKGHDVLFSALSILKQRGVVIPLVCTGALEDYRSHGFASSMLDRISELGLENQISFLGVLSRTEQIQVYRRAALIVQPSRFEGWSTVVEEARALHKGIVISDIPVHKEQNPPKASFFKDGDTASLVEVLGDAYRSSNESPVDAQLLKESNHARAQEFAREFLGICQQVYSKVCR